MRGDMVNIEQLEKLRDLRKKQVDRLQRELETMEIENKRLRDAIENLEATLANYGRAFTPKH